MNQLKKIPVLNNITLKIIALLFGYFLWMVFSKQQPAQLQIDLPIYFYNQPEGYTIEAPDAIQATIAGTKRDFYFGNIGSVHLDLAQINNEGEYEIDIYSDTIFVRNRLNLVNYYPSKIKIKVIK